MRIQVKLLILLLLIALLPLLVLSVRGQRATEAFGTAIADQGRAVVSAEIETRLQQTVAYASAIISAQQRHVETAVRLQAVEVERRLAAPAPVAAKAAPASEGDVQIYRDTDFKDPATWPPGTELALDHVRIGEGGVKNAVPISRTHQSFYLAGRDDSAAAQGQEFPPPIMNEVRRLASMDDVYRGLSDGAPGLYYWQFTSLQDGLHSAFPGHDGYPSNYDPRARVWYQAAIRGGTFVWAAPSIDVSTRRLLLSAALPLHGSNGEVIGVTGIDMDILSRLSTIEGDLGIGGAAASYIVRIAGADGNQPAAGADPAALTVRTLASSTVSNAGASWDAAIDQPVLVSGETADYRDMINDMAAGRGGLRHMPRNGADAIWAYGPVEGLDAALLYVVPAKDVTALADRARESIWDVTSEQLRLAEIASLGLMGIVAVIALLAARSVTEPLRHLAEVAKGLAAGRLDMRATVESSDEVGDLAVAFNAMVPELQQHIKDREGLALANEVQQKLLPAAAPKLAGYDIAGRSVYSEDVGGDYYDFIEMIDHTGRARVGVVVGDVTGHGVAAALTMTTVRVLLRSYAANGEHLLPAIRAVNNHLAADASGGRFVTLVYFVLDPAGPGHHVRWISAGQGPLLFYNPGDRRFEELEVHDIPLGVEHQWSFQETARTEWPAGGVLAIGTDGIWEMVNGLGESFGKDRFMEAIAASAHLSAQDICAGVTARLKEFRGAAALRDDVTLVVVKFV